MRRRHTGAHPKALTIKYWQLASLHSIEKTGGLRSMRLKPNYLHSITSDQLPNYRQVRWMDVHTWRHRTLRRYCVSKSHSTSSGIPRFLPPLNKRIKSSAPWTAPLNVWHLVVSSTIIREKSGRKWSNDVIYGLQLPGFDFPVQNCLVEEELFSTLKPLSHSIWRVAHFSVATTVERTKTNCTRFDLHD